MAVLVRYLKALAGLPPTVLLPSQTPVNGEGPALFANGAFYVQYGASSALAASTTETSILSNTSSTTVGFYTQGSAAAYPASTLGIQQGLLSLGTNFMATVTGIISNTSTPTLRLRWVLRNSAGTVVYSLVDTGAVTTTSTLSSSFLQFQAQWCVTATGTSGSVLGWGTVLQKAAVNNTVAPTSVAVDTTQVYTLDCLATWGTSSASNTLTAQNVFAEVTG